MLTHERAREIAGRAKHELERLYGPRLRGIYLYGSCARGDIDEDSDVDICIVLDEISSRFAEHERVSELGSRLSLDDNCLVSFLFVTESDFRRGLMAVHRAVQRKGVRV